MKSKVLDLYKIYFDKNETVTVKRMAEKLGIAISESDAVPKTVCIYNERKNKYVILTPIGQKNTERDIAHEIGHVVLGHFKSGNLVEAGTMPKGKYETAERQADEFAECLLRLSCEG